MTAYDRLRKMQESQYGLAAAAPADVAALLDEHAEALRLLDEARKQEPVAHLKRGTVIWSGAVYVGQIRIESVTATADWGRSKNDIPLYAAPVPAQPAVPEDVARDAARYRWLREHSQTGSVKTLLPLERCHYVVVHESAYEYQSFDDAIDAAIISATEGRKDE